MLDREFTFSDQRIIDEIKKGFVAVAGNTHELQNQKMPAGKWFMEMASVINPRVKNGVTAQGFYVVAADGTAFGFNNNRAPDTVLAFIKKGSEAFRQKPPAHVEIPSELIAARFANSPSPDVSTLRVFARIRPLPPGCDVLNTGIGRDHLWIYPEEVDELIRAADRHDANLELPRSLAYRLARYHLVDNVRGEPDMWQLGEVKSASFTATEKKGQGPNRTLSFKGTYEMSTANSARGLKGSLDGEMILDPRSRKVVRFRAYGEADAWGRGQWTPNPPPGHFTIVFAIVDAADEIARATPPQAAAYWDGDYRRAAGKE